MGPFPPFMMNGPHFHPPIDITVNSLEHQLKEPGYSPDDLESHTIDSQMGSLIELKNIF